MEEQVNYRPLQETTSEDFISTQKFVDESHQRFVQDAITKEAKFVGFTITTVSATEFEVSPGHLWDGNAGKVYVREESIAQSIISRLPLQDEKWLTLSMRGDEQESEIEPRDYLINADTDQTEPRMVAMYTSRVAELHIKDGLESTDPQQSDVPTGYTLIGHVLLDTTGIVEISIASENKLVDLNAVRAEMEKNKAWIASTDPQILSLKSDLAAMASALKRIQSETPVINEMQRDLANLKDLEGISDNYTSYGSDWLLDEDESDVNNADYEARVDEGARYPWANQHTEQLSLFNPYASEVKNHDGFLLPDYDDHVRLDLSSGFAGSLSISQYGYSDHEIIRGERTKINIKYGPTRTVCSNNRNYRWLKGQPAGRTITHDGKTYRVDAKWGEHRGFHWYRIRQYWRTTVKVPYLHDVTKTYTIRGAQLAQTFLAHQNGWLTGLDLYFESVADQGDIHLNIVKTENGQPDVKMSVADVTLSAADLKKRPEATWFEFAQPLFLEAGEIYAIVLTTQGDHKVSLTQGTNYTQGTLFYCTDGVYFQGDVEKDLMMRLHFARFKNPRTVVELGSMELDGGIADIELALECVEPENTSMIFEYKKQGDQLWYPLDETSADQLLGKPPLLHFRAVFKGDEFVMPGLSLPGSTFLVGRPTEYMRHITDNKILPDAAGNIVIKTQMEGWNEDKHTVVSKIRIGDVLTEAASFTDKILLNAESPTLVREFTFAMEPAISEFQIQTESSSTTELEIPHVANILYHSRP